MNPEITVIVPYHNEKDTIVYTLERVGEQSLPPKCAIFVNSSSTDDTSNVVEHWIQINQHKFSTQFRNVFENTSNPGSSKNVGIRLADTDWVAFMDCGQNFERDWLEKQFAFATENIVDVVSGVVYLIGENWVDRCAVAQTYGYKIERPCVPTSLLRKAVFERTGLFLEGMRSGYDVAWLIKLKKLGMGRSINDQVRICYIGINFSSNLNHLFRKSIAYAKPCVGVEGYLTPHAYIAFPLLVLLSLAISHVLTSALVAFYLVARMFVIPIIRSRSILFFKEHPFEAFLGLGLVGLVIDLGKMVGTIMGIKAYWFSRPGLR